MPRKYQKICLQDQRKLTTILVLNLVEVRIAFCNNPFRGAPVRDARGVGGSSYSQGNSKEEVKTNF